MKQLCSGLVAFALVLVWSPDVASADDWSEIEAFYRSEGHSEALSLRARAFFRLVTVGQGQGLRLLAKRYRSPRDPFPGEERFLMAGSLRYADRDAETLRAIDRWLEAARGKDPWLVFNAMLCRDGEALLAVSRDPKAPAWRRAAAIQAIAQGDTPVEDAVEGLAQVAGASNLPRKASDLHLVSGALGAALVVLQRRVDLDPDDEVDPDACRPLVDALMGLLKNPKLSQASLVLLERRLSQFGHAAPEPGAEGELGEGTRVGRQKDYVAPSAFMGVTVKGCRRIVYVIDMSDSMLEQLTVTEREELARRGRRALTGRSSRAREIKDRLDWKTIRTRFDAARAFLELSISGLDEKTSFAVVGFGDEAELLRSTPRLVRAKGGAVGKVAAELDRIKAKRYEDRDRDGLRGNTNLHAAMRLAFRVSTKGVLSAGKCARPNNPTATLADAIFVLSDGTPTLDDYPGEGPERDTSKGTYTEVDPETGKATVHRSDGGKGHQTYKGPYQDLAFFRPDLERQNLFRWTQIHVIGIGECDRYWGGAMAEIGEGELQLIGSDSGD